MTNFDRAAQVIYDEVNQTWERGEILTAAGEAERLANALADAGLLAPDLPAPDRDMRDPKWQAQYEDDWDNPEAPSIWDTTTLYEVGVFPGDPDITIWYDGEPLEPFSIDEVRSLRLALHAAEQTAKEQA
ncbi:hypothetical protein HMPREF2806_05805 [Corynebacterium sp. HMSC076G08]|uniref:hypothetical protein n=1 Tax=Corynebacterium sp. HMSC076G08 TaxID=1739310 RepID=UPI0008A55219|nr:hypothetical protein [Corynebacterium sp. HMSC076G08]OFK68824.1 hypothetical protein HMPREF2806_05805 [Corynebacterium sp. HMSC076G08]